MPFRTSNAPKDQGGKYVCYSTKNRGKKVDLLLNVDQQRQGAHSRKLRQNRGHNDYKAQEIGCREKGGEGRRGVCHEGKK